MAACVPFGRCAAVQMRKSFTCGATTLLVRWQLALGPTRAVSVSEAPAYESVSGVENVTLALLFSVRRTLKIPPEPVVTVFVTGDPSTGLARIVTVSPDRDLVVPLTPTRPSTWKAFPAT